MFETLKRWVLAFAKVPAEPHPPFGSPGSIRVFRAAPNYWKLLLVKWGLRQISGAAALVVFLSMTAGWQAAAEQGLGGEPAVGRHKGPSMSVAAQRTLSGALHTLELLGLGLFLAQMPFSLAAARLDYEMRWYMVTDRSMRLREGIFGVREMTLTFANVQNITIRQGPLQRLLGIADVVVRTAGGGSSSEQHGLESRGRGGTMHTGVLRAVDNAESVRDLILERLHKLRDAGLGDPDDRHQLASAPTDLVEAARELLAAARALR